MERCSKCILPTDFPGVTIDEKGTCNYCNDYSRFHQKLGKEELLKELSKNKTRSEFDCIVPLSGGKDSSYILYYIAHELKLNPIAVNYNSGFQNEIAAKNIENLCSILGVKLVKHESKLSERLIREMLLIAIRHDEAPKLDKICKNCETMLRNAAIQTARKYKVNNILWGSSALESGTNEKYQHYKNLSIKGKQTNNGKDGIGVKVKKFIKKKDRIPKTIKYINNYLFGWPVPVKMIPRVLKYNLLSVTQRFEMKVPLRYAYSATKVLPFTLGEFNFIHFYDYIEWDSMKNTNILKEKVKWQHPEGKEDRFDCLYHGFPNLYAMKWKGITADGINYCNFIRENKLTRDEALKREIKLQASVLDECNTIMKRVGLEKYNLPLIDKEEVINE